MKAKAQVPPEPKAEKSKSRFRVELTHRNHRVVMTDSIDKGRCVSYMVSYYVEGRRKQVRRTSLAKAKREAGFILTKIAQGEPDMPALNSTDRLIYLRACETLSQKDVPLELAVSQYVHTETLLKGIGTLTDAARFVVKQQAGLCSLRPQSHVHMAVRPGCFLKSVCRCIRFDAFWNVIVSAEHGHDSEKPGLVVEKRLEKLRIKSMMAKTTGKSKIEP